MKYILPFLFLILFNCSSEEIKNQKEGFGNLELKIHGLRSEKGNIAIYLFREERAGSFPLNFRAAYFTYIAPTTLDEEKTVVLEKIPFGRYAIFIHHDEIPNKKIDLSIPDKEILYFVPKWPVEGFGFSEYNRIVLMTPKFNDSAFSFQEEKKQVDLGVFYFGPRYAWLSVAIPVMIGVSSK